MDWQDVRDWALLGVGWLVWFALTTVAVALGLTLLQQVCR